MGRPGRPGVAGRKVPWQPLLAIGKVGPRVTQRHRTSRQRYEFRHQCTSPRQRTSPYRQYNSPRQRTSPRHRTSPYRQRTSPYQRTSRQWYELHPRLGAVGRSAPWSSGGPAAPDPPGVTAVATPLPASSV